MFASAILDCSIGVKVACAEVTKLLLTASQINLVDEQTRQPTPSV